MFTKMTLKKFFETSQDVYKSEGNFSENFRPPPTKKFSKPLFTLLLIFWPGSSMVFLLMNIF
jgi:hypothetical protein